MEFADPHSGHDCLKRKAEASPGGRNSFPRLSDSSGSADSECREVERMHSALPVRPGGPVTRVVPAETADGLPADCPYGPRAEVLDVVDVYAAPSAPGNGFLSSVSDAQESLRAAALDAINEERQNLDGVGASDAGVSGVPSSSTFSCMTARALEEQLALVLRSEKSLLAELRLLRQEYDARVAALVEGMEMKPKERAPKPPKATVPTHRPQAPPVPVLAPQRQQSQKQEQLLRLLQQQQLSSWPVQQEFQPLHPSVASIRTQPNGIIGCLRDTDTGVASHLKAALQQRANVAIAAGRQQPVQLPLDVSQVLAASSAAAKPGKAGALPQQRCYYSDLPRASAAAAAPAAAPSSNSLGGVRISAPNGAQGGAVLESHLLSLLLLQQQQQFQQLLMQGV